ncbi:hypothetical protein [Rhodobacter calidifons]|uniref:Uncharacterized protein n=1 Tax=Rhodobacter calidifons TaxID=2715277 RepID=A0ABX0G4G5_9RHOB|nr:hypothetical protein [Rhodobacter calidifons]NHB75867.1 hypothetical protein [Rhodobacter calidifons]
MHVFRFLVLYFTIASPISAQQGPELHPFHQIWFFSAPVSHEAYPRIFYQACNRSEGSTAFRWLGAGFGVAASAELPSNICAFKNTYSNASRSPKPYDVTVQGRGTGPIMTWTWDAPDSLLSQIYSYVEATISGPDGYADQSVISIGVIVNESGGAEIRISSSGVFDSLVVVFPEGLVNPNDVLNLGDTNAEISGRQLSDLTELSSPDTESLFGDQKAELQSVLIEGQASGGFSTNFKVEDLTQLGGTVVIFGRVDNDIVILNETAIPEVLR